MFIQLIRADLASLKVDAIVTAAESDEQDVTGGNLLCKFIIHTPVPRPGDENLEERLRVATMTSLQRAEELAISSVAMPSMCTGFADDTLDRCARIMLEATRDFGRNARSVQRVVYCLFGENTYNAFDRALREAGL